ncbi:MAG: hypothetical protein JSR85_02490 [Proteobacteria bacterium]|nr:hypothetical protein [Pseudomonadota bacterium]
MRFLFVILSLLLSQNAMAQKNCPQLQKMPCQKKTSWWKQGWAVTLFSGPLTSQTSSRIFSDANFEGSGIVGLAASKELVSFYEKRLGLELEGQAVQHFGNQKHFEINPAVLILRWKSFPWDNSLPTTLAIGDGISIATKKPHLEVKRRGHKKSAKTLNYVMAELTLSPACYPQWAFVLRYHHRSGMFGTFHGVEDASTAFAAGVKYWF